MKNSVYWYAGRGDWARSTKIGDWDVDSLSFGTAQWLDRHEPVGDLVLDRRVFSIYAHPKGVLAAPAFPASKRSSERFELTLREKHELPGDVQTRKVAIEVSLADGWGVRQILGGPTDVLAHLDWDPEERRFVVRGAPDWSIVRQRRLRR